jgi:hypothetical protein
VPKSRARRSGIRAQDALSCRWQNLTRWSTCGLCGVARAGLV